MVNTPVWHATHGKNASSFDPKLSLRKTTGRLPSYYSYPFAPPRVHNRSSSTQFAIVSIFRSHFAFILSLLSIHPLYNHCIAAATNTGDSS